jgi:hypothetical protein
MVGRVLTGNDITPYLITGCLSADQVHREFGTAGQRQAGRGGRSPHSLRQVWPKG